MNTPDMELLALQSTAASVYNELRLEGRFCDVVLIVEGEEFNAHKNILWACSSYFQSLFRGDWIPGEQLGYHIPGVSAEMMSLIIEYAYTHRAALTEQNAAGLLAAADQFSVMGLLGECVGFLKARLSPGNCVGVWRMANTHSCPDLWRQAYAFFLRHFQQVAAVSEEFLALSAAQLAEAVETDELNVGREEVVYEAVRDWVAHRPAERNALFSFLLSKVRLALMSADFLENHVMNHALVQASADCQAAVSRALSLRLLYDQSTAWDFSNPQARPRLPHAVLLATGGWSGSSPTSAFEAYDVRADCWVALPHGGEPSPRAYQGTACVGGYVYCVGGFDGFHYYNSSWRFDPVALAWRQVAPMHVRRCYVSVATLGGCLYAMGGCDGHQRLFSAERYQPEANQWALIAPMHMQRSDASAAALHGKIYICGGFTGTTCLPSAETYSPETNQWTVIANMSVQRSGVGVIAYREQIYVVGGFDGHSRQSSVEAYDPRTNSWRAVAPMGIPRSNFGIEVVDDRLFVVGGFNGFTTEFTVEAYDETTHTWVYAKDMGTHRSALGCCVVSGLPNISRYTVCRSAPRASAMELGLD